MSFAFTLPRCAPTYRFALSLPIAAGVSLGLSVLMQALISTPEVDLPPPVARDDFRIVSERDLTPVQSQRDRPELQTELVSPPPFEIEIPEGVKPGDSGLGVPRVQLPVVGDSGPVGTGGIFIQTAPRRVGAPPIEYPSNMSVNGSCQVSFAVEASGVVSNPAIVSCTHDGFARAALRAVGRTAYLPAQGEFGPVATEDVRLTIDFRIAE